MWQTITRYTSADGLRSPFNSLDPYDLSSLETSLRVYFLSNSLAWAAACIMNWLFEMLLVLATMYATIGLCLGKKVL
jgi:hypothetical protein